jgi:hypothetical protein
METSTFRSCWRRATGRSRATAHCVTRNRIGGETAGPDFSPGPGLLRELKAAEMAAQALLGCGVAQAGPAYCGARHWSTTVYAFRPSEVQPSGM